MGKLKSSRSGAIPTRFLKDGVNEVANSLSFLYNRSIEQGSFPSNLKIVSVCLIYKDEGHKDNRSNYRPMSILPIIALVLKNVSTFNYFAICKAQFSSTNRDSVLNTLPNQVSSIQQTGGS